jgi:hypothetical protein
MTAPLLSFTVPVIPPVGVWEQTEKTQKKKAAAIRDIIKWREVG